MIGVLDSGIGGIAALYELKRLYPSEDLIYLADRENAPYGKKSERELTICVSRSIKRLTERGADKILIACCTASTVYDLLPSWQRRISTPIIAPAASLAARLTKSGEIGVIATERTVASHAFARSIHASSPEARVRECNAQSLVELVEGGVRDGNLTENEKEKIKSLVMPAVGSGTDTLILGCTHFSHLQRTVGSILGDGVKLVSPAIEGARATPKPTGIGTGVIIYL